MSEELFAGFTGRRVPTERGTVYARVGGSGPAVLLLHGYPQTHLMWHGVARDLADRCTVVAADLPGYGDSFRPVPAPDHRPHGKRRVARDGRGQRRDIRGKLRGRHKPVRSEERSAGMPRTGIYLVCSLQLAKKEKKKENTEHK